MYCRERGVTKVCLTPGVHSTCGFAARRRLKPLFFIYLEEKGTANHPGHSLRSDHFTGIIHQSIDGLLYTFLQVPPQEGHIQTLSDRPQHGPGFRVAEVEFKVRSERLFNLQICNQVGLGRSGRDLEPAPSPRLGKSLVIQLVGVRAGAIQPGMRKCNKHLFRRSQLRRRGAGRCGYPRYED